MHILPLLGMESVDHHSCKCNKCKIRVFIIFCLAIRGAWFGFHTVVRSALRGVQPFDVIPRLRLELHDIVYKKRHRHRRIFVVFAVHLLHMYFLLYDQHDCQCFRIHEKWAGWEGVYTWISLLVRISFSLIFSIFTYYCQWYRPVRQVFVWLSAMYRRLSVLATSLIKSLAYDFV